MTDENKLIILKKDLQVITTANDEYLFKLLELSKKAISNEGITLNDDIQSDMVVIQYAAYLFRKRAADNAIMPRYLRYQLNNMLFKQKAGADNDI